MDYRPQSPDLSGYAPQSPDLSDLQARSPDPRFHQHHRLGAHLNNGFTGTAPNYPTSAPQQSLDPYNFNQPSMAAASVKNENDGDFLPNAPAAKSAKKGLTQSKPSHGNDATLGVELKTSFPVARIKRIMQADEDVGKVAQVTPHVVSRALELFMIKLISASAEQARGNVAQGSLPGERGGKGGKKVLAQHMKKSITTNDTFDFLTEIANKVPDAPAKAAVKTKDESDSEEVKKPKRKAAPRKKKKGSGDDL
ncbi:hypothetical protein LTR97_006736 [Elasticomyces elasticus]|uniref:Transcription factor CBF/NF-Y/archaeal histone domain-containing protein n=1 Tax=Elasticomyces elasticus TaxID=574655 RepID=A0AAN8A2P7_9PEZI|nr:hypothetical protein LTR97_006736 [Elasticomyces elasticus]